jgi:sugar-specific transcriptional regulator TrmB
MILGNLGLSSKEIKIYLELLKWGASTTGKICKETGIPSSKVYPYLDSLVKKGLVSYSVVAGTRNYKANSPELLKSLLKSRKEEIKKTELSLQSEIEKLKKIKPEHELKHEFNLYEGLTGIRAATELVLDVLKPGEAYCVSMSSAEIISKLNEYFMEFHKRRIKRKIWFKLILDESARKYGEERGELPLPYTESRYLKNFHARAEFGVFGDHFMTGVFFGQPYQFVIKNKHIADAYQKQFDFLWGIARK